jgi:hypothetical protein
MDSSSADEMNNIELDSPGFSNSRQCINYASGSSVAIVLVLFSASLVSAGLKGFTAPFRLLTASETATPLSRGERDLRSSVVESTISFLLRRPQLHAPASVRRCQRAPSIHIRREPPNAPGSFTFACFAIPPRGGGYDVRKRFRIVGPIWHNCHIDEVPGLVSMTRSRTVQRFASSCHRLIFSVLSVKFPTVL